MRIYIYYAGLACASSSWTVHFHEALLQGQHTSRLPTALLHLCSRMQRSDIWLGATKPKTWKNWYPSSLSALKMQKHNRQLHHQVLWMRAFCNKWIGKWLIVNLDFIEAAQMDSLNIKMSWKRWRVVRKRFWKIQTWPKWQKLCRIQWDMRISQATPSKSSVCPQWVIKPQCLKHTTLMSWVREFIIMQCSKY